MKTIVFFSRCELADLYGGLSKHLQGRFNIVHLAYSAKEADLLQNKYGITEIIIFKDEVRKLYESTILDHEIIMNIDADLIEQTKGRFCLNSAIQSDRGFEYLEYSESLILAQVYYSFWTKFITESHVDFLFHEPTSLFFNHIASVICKKNSAYYICMIMVFSEHKYSYMFIAGDNAQAIEFEHEYNKIRNEDILKEKERVDTFLRNYRETTGSLLEDIIRSKVPYFRLLYSSIKAIITKNLKRRNTDRILDNTDYWLVSSNRSFRRFINSLSYMFRLRYDEYDPDKKYYFYPLHLEPEAVVLYWGDGIYKNQIKLIENIAAQLPPGTYLYVKDHPHHIGYRELRDYQRMQCVPNIRILRPELKSKEVIKHAAGVLTINGTACFEAVMMNKHAYIFGNAFYGRSKRVHYVQNIKDLRSIFYKNEKMHLRDDDELYKTMLAYLNASHEGVTDYYGERIGRYPIDTEENIKRIASNINNLCKNT